MRHRFIALVGALATGIAVVSLASGTLLGQSAKTNTRTANTYEAPRTQDGQPDLQGIWVNNNATAAGAGRQTALDG